LLTFFSPLNILFPLSNMFFFPLNIGCHARALQHSHCAGELDINK
jgi:hypothetical protein